MSIAIGPLIASAPFARFQALMAHGALVWRQHEKLQGLIRPRLGARVCSYFARPVHDSGAAEMRWYAGVQGQAQPFKKLSPHKQSRCMLEVEKIVAALNALVVDLRSGRITGVEQPEELAEHLLQALRVPNLEDSLVLIGDQPVVAFWGFQKINAAAANANPSKAGPATSAQGATPAPRIALQPSADLRRPSEPVTAKTRVQTSATPRSKTPGAQSPATSNRLPNAKAASPKASAAAGNSGRKQRWGVAGLILVAATIAAYTLSGNRPQTPRDRPGIAELASESAAVEPTVPSNGIAPTAQSNVAVPPPALATSTNAPARALLELPDSATKTKSVAFLAGSWGLGGALLDSAQNPLDVSFEFDEKGQGQVLIKRLDRPGVTCKGRARGSMERGKLRIQDLNDQLCSDGSRFRPSRIDCVKFKQATQCAVIESDGARYLTELRRL